MLNYQRVTGELVSLIFHWFIDVKIGQFVNIIQQHFSPFSNTINDQTMRNFDIKLTSPSLWLCDFRMVFLGFSIIFLGFPLVFPWEKPPFWGVTPPRAPQWCPAVPWPQPPNLRKPTVDETIGKTLGKLWQNHGTTIGK
jgi:hypothetical protein